VKVSIFTALADPTRRHLLENLAKNSPKTATQLANDYPITRPGLIKHLNILEEAGLVKISQKGRDKGYILTPEPLSELEEWVREINEIWGAKLLRLKEMLENEAKEDS
jgi:DNA-binding transcriptional ArsR family regulator